MFVLTHINELNRTVYYKHYDGKRPVYGAKGGATVMDSKTADMVLAQLNQLGFKGIEKRPQS
jgi:hypothetical protein